MSATLWRIHLGAHKTATTHLQDALSEAREALLEAGVDALPTTALRAVGFPPPAGRADWRLLAGGWAMRRRLEAAVAPLRRGPRVLAVSEENVLGLSTGLLSDPLYPGAENRLRRLRPLARAGRLQVFLSVRDPAAALPSAYAQVLRSRPVPGGFAAVRAQALAAPPSWSALARRIIAALPGAPLTVWRFEDYVRDAAPATTAFLGCAPPPRRETAAPTRTKAPSADAIARLEALPADLDGAARAAAVAQVLADDRGGARFAPFSDAEAADIGAAYALDMARMRALENCAVIGAA